MTDEQIEGWAVTLGRDKALLSKAGEEAFLGFCVWWAAA